MIIYMPSVNNMIYDRVSMILNLQHKVKLNI